MGKIQVNNLPSILVCGLFFLFLRYEIAIKRGMRMKKAVPA